MAHLPTRRRLPALALGVAAAAALAFLPGVPAAAEHPAGAVPVMSYLVNTAPGHGAVQHAEHAVRALGGTVVTGYEQIGVVVARSADRSYCCYCYC